MPTPEEILRRPYRRLFVADEEQGGFSAQIVEFSGCFAEGDTMHEAADNLERVAEAWLTIVMEQGQTIPEPTGGK